VAAPKESRAVAAAVGLGIAGYFSLGTVWFPSWVLRLPAIASASRLVADLVGLAVWATFLALGMWSLRTAQRKGRI
jgi:hypothetical protein